MALTGEPTRFEEWFETTGRWFDVSAFQTEPGHFGVVFTDITRRKRAEESLRESEAVLRSFFDSAGMMRGIQELVDGRIVHVSCNAAVAAMLGVDRESIPGKFVTEMGTSDDTERLWVGLYEKSRSTGQPFSQEYSRRGPDGREYWVLATATYLGTSGSGNPRFGYTALDLTERKRAEQALRESEERFRSVVESMSEGLLVFDSEGNLTYQNPASLRIHGFGDSRGWAR